MSKGFRVTVEDLDLGTSESMVAAAGDYMFIPFEPCHLAHAQKMGRGTYQLTIKGHAPQQIEPDGEAS